MSDETLQRTNRHHAFFSKTAIFRLLSRVIMMMLVSFRVSNASTVSLNSRFSSTINRHGLRRKVVGDNMDRRRTFHHSLFMYFCTPIRETTILFRRCKPKVSLPIQNRIPFHSPPTLLRFHSQNEDDGSPVINELLLQQIPPKITVQHAVQKSLKILEEKSIPEPEESVLHLLSHALNLSWENGYRQLREILSLSVGSSTISENAMSPIQQLSNQCLSKDERDAYISLLERRMQHEPLQYIIGKWDFHFLTGLKIKKPMLCPRPETEELVELVLAEVGNLLRDWKEKRKMRILDVGCGTGAIGIAIANKYPAAVQVVALDVLPEAVDLSNENAEQFLSRYSAHGDSKLGVKSIYEAMLCSATHFTNNTTNTSRDLSKKKCKMNFDIVVSNPPYIPLKDMIDLSSDVVEYESYEALCGGEDGLNVIRDIVHRLPEWTFSSSSRAKHCWMEVDESHPRHLARWLSPGSVEARRCGVEYVESYTDFCGRDRFVKLRVS